MAYAYSRGKKFWIGYLDNRGRPRREPTVARTKTEAVRFARELERQHERQRKGLEPLPPEDGGGTVAALFEWWLENYSKPKPHTTHNKNVCTVTKHFLESPLAHVLLVDLTPGLIENFLQSKTETHSPQTVNHLRRFLVVAFNRARKAGRYLGKNPASDVERRQVTKKLPDFLSAQEVPLVLRALAPRWRALFATAIYTGMREGELLGLVKSKVNLERRQILVATSYGHGTTKGGREEPVPLAAELIPFLEHAMASSPSALVFPKHDGSGRMMREDVKLGPVLRAALARAGIVTGYNHVCRKRGCGHGEQHPDAGLRHCPTHKMKLWPKALVRQIRFHDLRHTTASLLIMAGADLAAVQKILRHKDPKMTTQTYAHLEDQYLHQEIDRLKLGVQSISPVSRGSQHFTHAIKPLLTSGSQSGRPSLAGPVSSGIGSNDFAGLNLWARRDSNPLPSASEADTLSR